VTTSGQCRQNLQQADGIGEKEKKSMVKVITRWSGGMPEEAAYELLGWFLCKRAAVRERVSVTI